MRSIQRDIQSLVFLMGDLDRAEKAAVEKQSNIIKMIDGGQLVSVEKAVKFGWTARGVEEGGAIRLTNSKCKQDMYVPVSGKAYRK